MTVLRLLSYNVRSLRDDADAVARIIRDAQPQVVAIQEAPRLFRWRSKCAALARRSGLVIVTGGRPAAANLLLCTLAVDVLSSANVLFSRDSRLHQRGTALAVLGYRGARLALAGIHLDLEQGPRLRHVGELHRVLDLHVGDPDVPRIIAGDVNDLPGTAVWNALVGRGTDAWAAVGAGDGWTFSVGNPRKRIDAVFADPRVPVRSATVLDSPDVAIGSDHRPLLVELDLP